MKRYKVYNSSTLGIEDPNGEWVKYSDVAEALNIAGEMKPKKCCDIGSYSCQIPMSIAGRVRWIDYCIADIVAALNAAGIETVASCCGHGQIPGEVNLMDGREITVYYFKNF